MLDLITYHYPGFYALIRIWYYAALAVATEHGPPTFRQSRATALRLQCQP